MTTYNKENEIIFKPEDEQDNFPRQTKVLRPKKYKTKMTAKRKSNFKRKAVKMMIILVLIIGALGYSTYKINEWFNAHTLNFRSPIILQTPITIEQRVPEVQAGLEAIKEAQAINFEGANFIHKTEASTPASSETVTKYDEIVRKVYQLESSSGKNDSCKKQGKFNGYGFGQSTFTWNCFASHEEVTNKVTAWFEKRVPEMGLSTALCYYNTGHKTASCDYYKKFLTLK